MTGPDSVDRDDLHAYVDGRLSPEDRTRVESWLAQHPEDAAAVHAYRLQNTGLRDAFTPVLDEPVPPELEAVVTGRRTGGAMPGSNRIAAMSWARLAASVLLVLAGGVGGWLLHGWQGAPGRTFAGGFVEQAVGAHRVFVSEVRHPVEVRSDQEAHLVAWLSKRVGTELRAPDMREAGFDLVGGRLLAEGARPAAQFMYEEDGGRRLTVYVRAAEGTEQTAFRFVAENGVSAFFWIDDGFAYALVAPLERERLLDIAHKVYRELDR